MKTASYLIIESDIRNSSLDNGFNELNCQLVFGFGDKKSLSDQTIYDLLRSKFPAAHIALCSTAGEIYGNEVMDGTLSITGIEFDKTHIGTSQVNISDFPSSYEAGVALVKKIDQKHLRHLFILSDGGKVNGSELVRGIESVVHNSVAVTGGLAGDGTRFESTLVGLDGYPQTGNIIALGFYGDAIRVTHGSVGGWEMFGLEKVITKSRGNELFEIENEQALDIYKKYLGKYADGLPGSALLFPLSMQLPGAEEPLVRTILSVNPEQNSMVFAGDVPEGAKVRFMKANFDKLIDAASDAAQKSLQQFQAQSPKLALLISCVGRKLILGERVDEEVEAVRDIFGPKTMLSGFYSYGEISPLQKNTKCELHNQTMTITTFDEI